MTRTISFDVLGTCFGFEGAARAIAASHLGRHVLTPRNIDPVTLTYAWFFAAQRDFTYASLAGGYTPIATILRLTFPRACAVSGVPIAEVREEDVRAVMEAVKGLEARPGLKEAFAGLRGEGWDVYAVTNGGRETCAGWFEGARVELDEKHLLSCDDIRVAKPEVKVYENAKTYLAERTGEEGHERWFAAAHAWDLMAARAAGFKTAYLAFEEHDPVTEVFGKFDVYAEDFKELLEKLKKV